MDTEWASHNLQVIRTLMERASVYRRALAPIMTVAGVVGLIGATLPCFLPITTNRGFSAFWMLVSLLGVIASYVLVRRQALKDMEPFWSPPTRRVTQALCPAFFVGLVAGAAGAVLGPNLGNYPWILSIAWVLCYGCGLHAAGFFMVRGMKLFGWIFVLGGCALLGLALLKEELRSVEAAHYIMGSFFGVLQLAYGIYLYFTEKRDKSA